jgi:hypothetical protein
VLLSNRLHSWSVGLRRDQHIGHKERVFRPDPLPKGTVPLPTLSCVRAGLCDSCAHQKIVKSGRGSVFSMCLRHKTDERFPKYPRLPVERCPGYERRELSESR